MENINSILDTKLSGEIKKNDKGEMGDAQLDTMLPMVYNLYRALIDTCDRYMEGKEGNKRRPRTKSGKERIRIVEEIKLFAEKDINVLMSGNLQGVDLESKTLREAIANARTRVINLKKSDEEHTHMGGSTKLYKT